MSGFAKNCGGDAFAPVQWTSHTTACSDLLTAVFSVVDPRSMMRAQASSDGVLNRSHMHGGVHRSISAQPAIELRTYELPKERGGGRLTRGIRLLPPGASSVSLAYAARDYFCVLYADFGS